MKRLTAQRQLKQATFQGLRESVIERPQVTVFEFAMVGRAPLCQDFGNHSRRDRSDVLTVPYIAFHTMRRDTASGQLQLEIEGFRISVRGSNLRNLWRDLQLYRVREIHESKNHAEPSTTGRAVVEKITFEKLEDLPQDD